MREKTEVPEKPGFISLYKGDFFIIVILMLFVLGKEWQAKLPMSDFRVYYRAAQHLSVGKTLYNPAHFYRFKYPPPSAAFFLPFLPLPFWMAKIAMAGILIFSLVLIFHILGDLWPCPEGISNWRIETPGAMRALICLSFGGMFLYEFYLGQLTLPIIALLLLAISLLKRDYDIPAGFVYAISLHLKPYGWPIFIWGIFRKRVGFIFSTLLFFGFIATFTVPFFGLTGSVPQWEGFFREMNQLNDAQLRLNMPENHSLGSALIRWFRLDSFLGESGTIHFANLVKFILLAFPLLIFAAFNPNGGIDEIPWLLSAVPLIGPPEYKYFQMGLPLMWLGLVNFRRISGIQKGFLFVGMLGLGINIYDLWGKTISNWMTQVSVVTAGGLGIYLSGVAFFLFPPREEIIPEKQPEISPDQNYGNSKTIIPLKRKTIPQKGAKILDNDRPIGFFPLLLTFILFSGIMGYSELKNLQDRLICRSCNEETSRENVVCKNCGLSSLAPYPQRVKEMESANKASIRFKSLLASGSAASATEHLKIEFPELPPEDLHKLTSF